MKIRRRTKQVLSWPVIIICFILCYKFIQSKNEILFDIIIVLYVLVVYIRKEEYLLDRKYFDEYFNQYKWVVYTGVSSFLLSSFVFIYFVINDINTFTPNEYMSKLLIIVGLPLLYMFIPFEFWLFKKNWLA